MLLIDVWVLSCRAFARGIEEHILTWLFENYDVNELRFAYSESSRNQVSKTFIAGLGVDVDNPLLSRATYMASQNAAAVHQILETEETP